MPTLNRHPIYVVSKGRWQNPLTAKALEHIGAPYQVVIEPQEHEAYARALGADKLLTLPFANLGHGSIPARNWIWEHALERGASRHWILDDNIRAFWRLLNNQKIRVVSPACFAAVEDFADRYENVALAGMNYTCMAKAKQRIPPLYLNTRIYSCILILNSLLHRWRGTYNEDTDLSLRALKDGWCTVNFNAFLCEKISTMTMKGGNTDELYAGDGRRLMAQSLVAQHPREARLSFKWGRFQHHVDYRPFKRNALKLRPGVSRVEHSNNYGLVRQVREGDQWRDAKQSQ